MKLKVEVRGQAEPFALPGEGAELVAFMSFAVSRGFGAQHPLIALADLLHESHGVRMGPLTTFYEGLVEDREDAEKLELAWQRAEPLAEALDAAAAAMGSDARAQTFIRRAGAEGLAEQTAALALIAKQAAQSRSDIRLSYTL